MPMTGVPATDYPANNVVHCLRKRITFAVPGTTVAMTVGKIPKGACVVGGGAMVITAFDGTGTDLIDIGTSDDADAYATDLDVSSVGFKAMDELATHNDHTESAEVTVTATYADQNTNAAAGVADIIVLFVTSRDIVT